MLRLSDAHSSNNARAVFLFAADLVLIVLFTIALYLPGLGQLEFFRHTEADRTLIAWEMLETGDYLVPHLLGSEIFTKPPVYYWLLAGFIDFFGHNEATVRLCSVTAAILLSLCIYVFTFLFFTEQDFKVECCRARARSAALIFATFGQTMLLATLAEIDMTYALFSVMALFLLLLAMQRECLLYYLIAGVVLGLAILVKGPLALVLFCAVFFLLELTSSLVGERAGYTLSGYLFSIRLRGFLMALILGLAPYTVWLLMIAGNAGFEQVDQVIKSEFIDRYLSDGSRARGSFFYVYALLSSMLPWSFIFFLPLAVAALSTRLSGSRGIGKTSGERWRGYLRTFNRQPLLITFSWLTILSGFLFLSLAEAKSSRYIFMLLPFFSIVMADYLHSGGAELICSTTRSLAGYIFRKVSWPVIVRGCGDSSVFCRNCSASSFLLGVVFLVMLFARLIYVYVYVPFRVERYSVRPIVAQIELSLRARGEEQQSIRIYQLDMFQRWLTYYLRRNGVEVRRLTEEVISRDMSPNAVAYILLDAIEEGWRVNQLEECQIRYSVVSRLSVGKDIYLLLEMPFDALAVFRPKRLIPSVPETPRPGNCSKDRFST
ncbi:MAG: glycosyltransferase family 39 protein [bacterium]|nr:glycosyltransferase family 39 protein [bacterium]